MPANPLYPAFDPNCADEAPASRDPRTYMDRGDGRGPRGGIPPRVLAPPRTAGVQVLTRSEGGGGPADFALEHQRNKLLYAQLLCSGDHPITSIGTTYLGDDIGTVDQYRSLYKNSLGRIVVAKVSMDVGAGNPGARASLSLGNELSDQNKIDELYASGTLNSSWILLKNEQILWINTADTNFSLASIIFRVLLFDPASVFGEDIIP